MTGMFEHLSPELVISGLRLLMEGYKFGRDQFKDKKTPERVEEIVTRAEKSPRLGSQQIEEEITNVLDPSDAAIVKGDLELLSLLLLPAPKLDAFDYWGKLTQLVSGLQAYAAKNRLFELRGSKRQGLGEVLYLPQVGDALLPAEVAANLPRPYSMQSLKGVKSMAFLRKDANDFPITLLLRAEFNQYHSVGGPPSVESAACFLNVTVGQQKHWLGFDCGVQSAAHFSQGYEYMLDAARLISIFHALRDDIGQYAKDVQADERKVEPLFAAIDEFVKSLKS